MRWDGLFADLEAQAESLYVAQRAGETEGRARAELARLPLVDRLRPSVGAQLRLRCRDGLAVNGTLLRAGAGWLLIDEGAGREAVIASAAVSSLSGLSRWSAPLGSMPVVESRLGLTHVLRGIARDRSGVRLHLDGSVVIDGTLDRVGADFLEMAVHPAGEARRRRDVLDLVVVVLSALVSVRRDA
jgi:hypothetical protein